MDSQFQFLKLTETHFVAQHIIVFVGVSQTLDNYLYSSAWEYSVLFVKSTLCVVKISHILIDLGMLLFDQLLKEVT